MSKILIHASALFYSFITLYIHSAYFVSRRPLCYETLIDCQQRWDGVGRGSIHLKPLLYTQSSWNCKFLWFFSQPIPIALFYFLCKKYYLLFVSLDIFLCLLVRYMQIYNNYTLAFDKTCLWKKFLQTSLIFRYRLSGMQFSVHYDMGLYIGMKIKCWWFICLVYNKLSSHVNNRLFTMVH